MVNKAFFIQNQSFFKLCLFFLCVTFLFEIKKKNCFNKLYIKITKVRWRSTSKKQYFNYSKKYFNYPLITLNYSYYHALLRKKWITELPAKTQSYF